MEGSRYGRTNRLRTTSRPRKARFSSRADDQPPDELEPDGAQGEDHGAPEGAPELGLFEDGAVVVEA